MNTKQIIPCHCRVKGFSLVEVLVAVAIVVVLGLLSLSVTSGLVEHRDRTTCMSNLRQIYMAFEAYSSDNHAKYPPIKAGHSNGPSYPYSLREYIPGYTEWGGSPSPKGVYVCPAWYRITNGYLSASHYSLNEFVYEGLEITEGAPKNRILKPSRTILLTDMCWYSDRAQPFSTVNNGRPPGISYGGPIESERGHARGGANIAFADGHIEYWDDTRKLADIIYRNRGADDVWRIDK